ncbi:MAG TPA: bifunctional phosphoribosyl-AMP cyclohydrolase/phosphoribosyl-ATP diphosphatase HisIE [Candidatus Marinimicrobia bacterium]|nr:bifunctional phosphoribosyl-AMP cyclohydrolase/phosphoribosyl-ATP diphosphatase HisIE [Candidatus Neomarinimicrobiota bacterium]
MIDFDKNSDGLVPAIVQDAISKDVLMLGYMNRDAYYKTLENQLVTFYSRSRQRLWTKGETSGNFLKLVSITPDCDGDTLLVLAIASGPVCHTGNQTCFGAKRGGAFLFELEEIIRQRAASADPTESYTARLLSKGMKKIAQKVGEEAVETVIEAIAEDRERLKEETADLLYHLLVLLTANSLTLDEIGEILKTRHKR